MSMIHSSCVLLGSRSALIEGGQMQDRQVHHVQQAGKAEHGKAYPLALGRSWGHVGRHRDAPALGFLLLLVTDWSIGSESSVT